MNINKFQKFNKFQPFNKSTQLDAPNIKQGGLSRSDLTKGIDNSKPQTKQCERDLGTRPKDDFQLNKWLTEKNARQGDIFTDEAGRSYVIVGIKKDCDGRVTGLMVREVFFE